MNKLKLTGILIPALCFMACTHQPLPAKLSIGGPIITVKTFPYTDTFSGNLSLLSDDCEVSLTGVSDGNTLLVDHLSPEKCVLRLISSCVAREDSLAAYISDTAHFPAVSVPVHFVCYNDTFLSCGRDSFSFYPDTIYNCALGANVAGSRVLFFRSFECCVGCSCYITGSTFNGFK